jgi:CHASE2 domain-containing sensor protein
MCASSESPTPPGGSATAATPDSWKSRCRQWGEHARTVLCDPATFSVLFMVLLFNVIIRIPAVQDNFPVLQRGELLFHRFLFSLSPRNIAPKWVRVVEIDDAAHGKLGEPTDRAYLADVISNAVKGDAFTIVLDFKLLAPSGLPAGQDDPSRKAADQKLVDSINNAALAGVPVVIGVWLEEQPDRSFARRPDFFLDRWLLLANANRNCRPEMSASLQSSDSRNPTRLPACAWLGNINMPVDMRQVPLSTPLKGGAAPLDSLSLAAVEAFEASLDRQPRARDNPCIADSIAEGRFVYGSFIPQSEFQTIPIETLHQGTPQALADSRGRILVVGGNWHDALGNGDLVDAHDTPVGKMAGIFVHANYIEALLDERFTREVPLWMAVGFDLVAGIALYLLFHNAKGWLAQLVVLLVPAALLVVSYILFTNLNYYLDFIFPLAACFVHLGKEYVEDYVHLRSNHRKSTGTGE